MDAKSCEKLLLKYICKSCDYLTCKKSSMNKHNLSAKHLNRTKLNALEQKSCEKEIYTCKKCNKAYKARNSLWYHEKKCINTNNENNENETNLLNNLVLEIVKSNTDAVKQMLEICKNNNNTNNNSNNTIHSNNKTFNLQIFLNEQCKNAMNLSDFIASIKLQMSDLESLGTLGYTEGMHTIIFKEFIDIELFNRPFHCSDLKREIIYIKDGDKWEKEDPENKKLKNAIRSIEKKNFKLLNERAEQHPKINDCNSPDGDKYLKLLNHATSGDNEHMNKVIKKLAKNITIDKNMV